MIVGVPRESFPGERRVALVPAVLPTLAKAGLEVVVEAERAPLPGTWIPNTSAKARKYCRHALRSFRRPTSSCKCCATDQTIKRGVRIFRCSTATRF